MNVLLFLVLLVFAAAIVYQDLKSRLVSVFWLLGFGLCNLCLFLLTNSFLDLGANLLFCILYLLLTYSILLLYYFVKTRHFAWLLNDKIGWADIWLLVAIGACLDPAQLIYFSTLAFSLSLIFHFVFMRRHQEIPLAAYLCVIYIADKMILARML